MYFNLRMHILSWFIIVEKSLSNLKLYIFCFFVLGCLLPILMTQYDVNICFVDFLFRSKYLSKRSPDLFHVVQEKDTRILDWARMNEHYCGYSSDMIVLYVWFCVRGGCLFLSVKSYLCLSSRTTRCPRHWQVDPGPRCALCVVDKTPPFQFLTEIEFGNLPSSL